MAFDLFDVDFELFGSEADDDASHDLQETSTSMPDLSGYLVRSHSYWQQMPIPPEMPLCGTNILASMDDDTLLGMSPSLIAHVQRSEASDGLQVVSPRAVTLGGIAARTNHDKRTTDMFLAGSAASRNLAWPVIGEPSPAHLFWEEPIDAYPSDPAPRSKTVSTGLVPSTRLLSDPITKAFLVGRALVDLQRRMDVNGSSEALSSVLAACWGLSADEYEDMAEASLAPAGELLRYAIRSDDVYPVINAPVQARKCISVGANTAGRGLYGENAAIDWRRLRVLAESVFYQSSRLEGYTLAQMALPALPGNPRALPNRAGILQMRPLPGSVWTFDPSTFRLDMDTVTDDIPGVRVPDRVREAVVRYHEEVRPIARAAAGGAKVSFSHTLHGELASETSEALVTGFKRVLATGAAFSARGRTAAAAVRGFVYDSLSNSGKLSSIRALWLARYMHTTTEELNLTHLLDIRTTRHVAARLSDITTDLRSKLGVEAGKRGATLADWWSDMAAQLPREIAVMDEGSGSWSLALAHMILHPPTQKWASLVRAMAHVSHSAMARGHLNDVRLPAAIGSPERSFAAGAAVCRQIGASYGAYYGAMYDVACVLSARVRRAGNKMGAAKILLAGQMWDIRSKLAATAVLHAQDGTSQAAGVVNGRSCTYHITTAPYPAYQRWRAGVSESPFVRREVKSGYPHHVTGAASEVFLDKSEPVFTVPVGSNARLYRYAQAPRLLAVDMERTLAEIRADVASVVAFYDTEADGSVHMSSTTKGKGIDIAPLELNLQKFKPMSGTYWDFIAKMDPLVAQDVVDTVIRMDTAVAEEIEMNMYESEKALLSAVWRADEDGSACRARTQDTVV